MRRFDGFKIHDESGIKTIRVALQRCKNNMAKKKACPSSAHFLYRIPMSLASVRRFFESNAPDVAVLVTEASSATVSLAAEAHGVMPDQIAKTLCARVGEQVILVVMAGTARLDNRKFKDLFGSKPRMLGAEEVEALTSHPVGGVCPFGLPQPMPIYCDISLKAFDEVVPAAGATNAAVRISPLRMAELTGATWADLAQPPRVDGEVGAQTAS